MIPFPYCDNYMLIALKCLTRIIHMDIIFLDFLNKSYNFHMDKYEELKQIIKESRNIVVFTGAGISVPSGIPDFRSDKGIYNQKYECEVPPEEIISHHFYVENTLEFYKFYKKKMCFPNALPNEAHKFFASLEKQNKSVIVVTQNIDGLHQKAGSSIVYELHGSVHRNYCTNCHSFYDLDYILASSDVPRCMKCGGIIKPDVVLYEEGLDGDTIDRSIGAISTADTMFVIGTSLMVYPANSFVRYFKGHKLILINKDKTPIDYQADLVFNEDVIEVIKKIKDC